MKKNYFVHIKFLSFFYFLCCIPIVTMAQIRSQVGEWSEIIPFEIVPVAVANLPDGKLITWSSKAKLSFGGGDGLTYYELFDPSSGSMGEALGAQQTATNHDMFCPGITNMDDGNLLVTGGSSSEKASIYDYKSGTWSAAPDMNVPRGYHANVTLSDGSVFTVGGSWSGGRGKKLAEIWSPEQGWQELIGVPGSTTYTENDSILEPEGIFRLDNHTWLWPAPNGKIFHAGPSEQMNWIDVKDGGSVVAAGKRANDTYSMKGTTVMFDIGKLLKVGGATNYARNAPAKDNSFVIDINDENNVTVTPTTNTLSFSRTMHNSTVLPNGEVLVIGGLSEAIAFSDQGARLTAELYTPETNSWRTVAGMQVPRTYHSVAILMPDGRVFAGGGGLCGGCAVNHPNAEIYSPGYLFNTDGSLATRPVIEAPEEVSYNTQMDVRSDDTILEFALIRMSSATHSTNNEQRRIPLAFQKNTTGYTLTLPGSNLLPPGYYMLFAMDEQGVPSMAESIKVGKRTIVNEIPRTPNGNIAYRRPTTQSSTRKGGGYAARAVDGVTNGNLSYHSVTHTNRDENAWWRVDLGANYELSTIKVYNRTDCCAGRLNTAEVYVGTENSINPEEYTKIGDLGSSTTPYEFTSVGVTGRYVMVRLRGTDFLSLAEVEVFGNLVPEVPKEENIALNKRTEQSSTGYSGVSSRAVDGNTSGNYRESSVTHTNREQNAWWRVDLGANYELSTIKVHNRTDCCTGRLNTAEVYVGSTHSTDPNAYTKIGDLGASTTPYEFTSLGVTGRYVMIRLRGTDFLSLAEVEVYGDLVPEVPKGANIALNKITDQSSTGYSGVSSRAVDGNTSGTYRESSVTHTNRQQNAWWRVDLGANYELSTIKVYNRTDCCTGRLSTAEVYVGSTNSTDPNAYTKIGDLGSSTMPYEFTSVGVAGRYVMIRLRGTDFLSLAEVEVFGNPVSTKKSTTLASLNVSSIEANEVFLFPNPSSGIVNVNLASDKIKGALTIAVFNVNGQRQWEKAYDEAYVAVEEIDLSQLPSGTYYMYIVSDGGVIMKQLSLQK